MTPDPAGLPAAEVLLDAVAVLRELADGATPGHRGHYRGEPALWAAFGPDEARLLADLLEKLRSDWPHGYAPKDPAFVPMGPADAVALDLAYKLTGHQRLEVTR